MKRRYFIYYTIVIALFSVAMLTWFVVNGKSLVATTDALVQHLNSLIYYGGWLRSGCQKTWDLTIGHGADILTTLQYYVIGDPLNLLSVFVSPEKTEYLYGVLIFLRIYLAGLTFSLYSFKRNNDFFPTLLGSLVYCFSGFVLFFAARHPYFINPLIYLPLLALGVDRIYQRKSPWLYVGSIALAAISNFYFFYMIGILIVIYAVFDYFLIVKDIKKVGGYLLRFFIWTLLGVGIAAVFLLPAVGVLMGTSRFQSQNYIPVLYDLKYYIRFFSGFITTESPGYQTVFGFPVIAFLCLVLLFIKKQNKHLKMGVLLLTLLLCIPVVGALLNGFSYVTNRWCFGYTFLIAYIVVAMYPQITNMEKRERNRCFIFIILEVLACIAGCIAKYLVHQDTRVDEILLDLLLLVITFGILSLSSKRLLKPRTVNIIILSIVFIGVGFNSYYLYSNGPIGGYFQDKGTPYRDLSDVPSAILSDLDGYETVRYEEYQTKEKQNASLQTGVPGTNFYFSIVNPALSNFYQELNMNNLYDYKLNGSDQRSAIMTLFGVRYFVTNEKNKSNVPYNYEPSEINTKKGYRIYENKHALPLTYTYDNYYPYEQYQQLNAVEKQQVLIQTAVLENSRFSKGDAIYSDTAIPYTVEGSKGIKQFAGGIEVLKPNQSITLEFPSTKDVEMYVFFENLAYQEFEKTGLHRLSSEVIDKVDITLYRDDMKKTISMRDKKSVGAYMDRPDVICNMGYSQDGFTKIQLKFSNKGIYSFDNLQLIAMPVVAQNDYVAKRAEYSMEDLEIKNNHISGTIDLPSDKILCFAIPYSKGFKAWVDGIKVPVLQANTMFMALELEAGQHQIRMEYSTPYLRTGFIISLASIMVVIICILKRNTTVQGE